MLTPFYSDFDTQTLEERKSVADDARSPFQVDRDRVLFSYAFRRLQSKTQVFQSGEYDFYRTRLTHTLEVARIARSVAEALAQQSPRCHPDPDLVEAVGYAHDLGHPPFGHIGERKLNELMAPYGGFEGNAQTLRILTHLIFENSKGSRGMEPTRAFLDGVLKYKALHGERKTAEGKAPHNHFLYDGQAALREWAFHRAHTLPQTPDAWNAVKSIECQIMDWADDTAYSLHDIVDGVRAGFLTPDRIRRWLEGLPREENARYAPFADLLLPAIEKERLEAYIARRIGRYINGCRLVPATGPFAALSHRYCYRLDVDPEMVAESEFKKRLATALIFRHPAIQQVEFRGGHALERLFDALRDNYIAPWRDARPLAILPEPVGSRIQAVKGNEPEAVAVRARLICDYLSGLTDPQAIRLYSRLYQPGVESLGLQG